MGRLTVAFLWHMHQPYYVDCAEGRATLPWVRLHALKDYYDLPALARRFPSVKQTFNLVPCLLDQLEEYADQRLTDPFLEVASRGAHELSREDRFFLLREFFSYNPGSMAEGLPRLEQLRRMRGTRAPSVGDDAALASWREADYRDLQVLFHLAWSGPALRSRPEVARLISKGQAYTQDDLSTLLAVQREFMREVAAEYSRASAEGTIEISATPYYHPILPLLCDTDSAREASHRIPLPRVPFRHPEDARLQVREARRAFERRFGAAPAGMWPSEGALSNMALTILSEEGLRWAASDEDLLFASLQLLPHDFADRSRILHRPYIGPGGIRLFFRDHFLSDRIGFVYSTWEAEAAAADFVDHLLAIADAAGGEDRQVSVILDGENAWEFYPGNGEPFLSALFGRIAASDRIQARTFTSILDGEGREGPPSGQIDSIRTGSWIRADLTTWIGHEEKNRAWDLLAEARAVLGTPDPATPSGRSLLAAEGSDWFWWFGDEHSSAHDEDFDRTFRLHLQNAYILSNRKAPLALGSPIANVATHVYQSKPTGTVTVTLDGRATDYFEWLAAGRAEADHGRGTMSRAGRILSTLFFGANGEHLAIRLDTAGSSASEILDGLVLILEFAVPAEMRLRVPLSSGLWQHGPVQGCAERVVEMIIPLGEISAGAGSEIEFRVLLEDAGGKRMEALPSEGLVCFRASEDESEWVV